MSTETLVSLLVGSAISIVATWAFAHIYYLRAGHELQEESARLREQTGRAQHMVSILARALEIAGVIEASWDPGGELAGVVLHLSGTARGQSTMTGTLTVTPGSDQ